MATTARRLEEPDLLREYLRALARGRHTAERKLDDGRQIRTCSHCGEDAIFVPERGGSWYRCTACGHYA